MTFDSKLPTVGTTIFTVMSKLAAEHGAINLSQGFPDFDAPPELLKVAVLEAGMPAMITAGALAMLAGLAPELAAALVGYGVVLGMLTLPVLARLLNAN